MEFRGIVGWWFGVNNADYAYRTEQANDANDTNYTYRAE